MGVIRRWPIPLTTFCLIVSGGALLSWVFGPDEWIPFLSPKMKANTAIGLAIASASLLCITPDWRTPRMVMTGKVLALFVMLLGAATLCEYLFFNLGIDQLLRADLAQGENLPSPGRMAPNTAALFAGLGAALYWRDKVSKNGSYFSDYLLLAVGLTASAALIGYLYQFSPLYQVSSFLRISSYSAFLFLLLSLSAALVRPDHRPMRLFLSDGVEGVLARRLLPASIFIPIFLCWLTSRLREDEIINRPTAYSCLAIALIIVFSALIWWSVRELGRSENRRLEIFESENRTLATINQVGQNLVAELNMQKLVQGVTDAATSLTNAQFGAFFYNIVNEDGKELLLYAISGVAREKFSVFENPRATAVFHPTFMGMGTVRSSDITKDPRYGKSAPHFGIPKGHLPVRSYLAVSVISRTGQTLGGLFFGHEQPGIFTEQQEKIVEGLAAQTAIAMDNSKLYEELQKSVRARDEFLSIASHELKTPLTTLKLQAQTRERMVTKGMTEKFSMPGILKMVEADNRQIDRLARLVDDMLDIGRISTGKLTLNLETFDLSELAREVTERLRPEFSAAGISLNLNASTATAVRADRHRIEQVMVNLLTNALKYGAHKPVEIVVSNREGRVLFEVRDHGLGIAKENQQRIFERFERAITASEISGLGLGLFIVRQILQLHDGGISVESETGKGSIFSADLPRAST